MSYMGHRNIGEKRRHLSAAYRSAPFRVEAGIGDIKDRVRKMQ
jgi:hypothetical protein